MRHLAFKHPSRDAAKLVLMENDGTIVKVLISPSGSFRTIEQDGRLFRHQGVDRETGEMIYLPDVELLNEDK